MQLAPLDIVRFDCISANLKCSYFVAHSSSARSGNLCRSQSIRPWPKIPIIASSYASPRTSSGEVPNFHLPMDIWVCVVSRSPQSKQNKAISSSHTSATARLSCKHILGGISPQLTKIPSTRARKTTQFVYRQNDGDKRVVRFYYLPVSTGLRRECEEKGATSSDKKKSGNGAASSSLHNHMIEAKTPSRAQQQITKKIIQTRILFCDGEFFFIFFFSIELRSSFRANGFGQ